MGFIRALWAFLLSPPAAGLAAVYLAYEGLVDESRRSHTWIWVAVIFAVVASVMAYVRDQLLRNRFTRASNQIYDRLHALIGSLGELSGRYECWKIELYLAHWRPALSSQLPWLARQKLFWRASADVVAAVRLLDSPNLLDEGIVGLSYRTQQPLVWFNPSSGWTSIHNMHGTYSLGDSELATTCGAMKLTPVKSPTSGNCVGVLCVHTEPSFAPLMSGTLETDQFARRVLKTAEDLHKIMCV